MSKIEILYGTDPEKDDPALRALAAGNAVRLPNGMFIKGTIPGHVRMYHHNPAETQHDQD